MAESAVAEEPPPMPGLAAAQARLAAASTETPASLLEQQKSKIPGGSKRPTRRPATAPGPTEYTPNKQTHNAAAWSFGKASSLGGSLSVQQAKSMEPGPVPELGREIKDPKLYQAPKFSFGKGKTRDSGPGVLGGGSVAVGPGTYDWRIDVRSTSHRAPAHKILGRPTASRLPPQGTESGDLFRSTTMTMGLKGDGTASSLAAKLEEGKMLSATEKKILKEAAKSEPKGKKPAAAGGAAAAAAAAAAGAEGGGGGGAASAETSKADVPATGADGFKENLDGALNVDWGALTAKLPAGKDAAAVAKRKDLWKRADPNGNGYLSLAEVDMLVKDAIGREVFSAKPAIAAAFHAARKSGGGEQSGRAGDYIEKKEFRTLFIMLRQYYELYAMFNRLDTSDDRRIDLNEFKQGCAEMAKWGCDLPEENHQAEFDAIDVDDGGQILFQEFAVWALEKALDLPDDDDFDDGGEAAKHEAVGYIAERNAKMAPMGNGFVQREPAPKLCYTQVGAVVPIQMTAKVDVTSPQSMSRAPVQPVFQKKGYSNLPVLGGVPMRTIKPNTHLYPNTKISRHGMPAGLPYALGQLLLSKSREDKEAYTKATKKERIYGAASLELPAPAPASPAKLTDGAAASKAVEDKASAPAAEASAAPA